MTALCCPCSITSFLPFPNPLVKDSKVDLFGDLGDVFPDLTALAKRDERESFRLGVVGEGARGDVGAGLGTSTGSGGGGGKGRSIERVEEEDVCTLRICGPFGCPRPS